MGIGPKVPAMGYRLERGSHLWRSSLPPLKQMRLCVKTGSGLTIPAGWVVGGDTQGAVSLQCSVSCVGTANRTQCRLWFSLGTSVLNAWSLSQRGSNGWRGSSSGPCRGWQRGKAARGRICIRLGCSGFVGEVSSRGWGEGSFSRGARVECKVQRDG